MPTNFVSGANGFIGRHLVEYLLDRGDSVVGLTRSTSDTASLAPLFQKHGDRLRLVIGDLRDPSTLTRGLEEADYVYHLGAVLLGTREADFRESIVTGTQNLLEAARKARGRALKRFVYTSSLAAVGPWANGTPMTEDTECRPVSWYGTAKRDAEEIVRAQAGELPVTIVRPVAVYGEGEKDISRGTFPLVRAGLQPRIGLRNTPTSFVYVGDLVRGMVTAAESPVAAGKTYFFSEPQPRTTKQLGAGIADAMNQRIRVPMVTPPIALRGAAVLQEWLHPFTRSRPLVTRDKVRELTRHGWVTSPAAAERDLRWRARGTVEKDIGRSVRDWDDRRRRAASLAGLPRRDQVIQTFTLAVLVGVIFEGLAWLADWYRFDPPWVIFVVMFAIIGGVMGTVSLVTSRKPTWVQFAAGAAVGVGAELLNATVLHVWTFNPDSFGLVPGDVLRAIVFGLPAGLMPVTLNAIVRALYGRRLRLG
jgi:nucleoside-diphosphate-sugar epimerase